MKREQFYKRQRTAADVPPVLAALRLEKQHVNRELAAKFLSDLCGEDLFYDKRICFVYFLPYSDIAWMYQQNVQILMVAQSGLYLVETSLTTSKLVLYIRDGKRYVADTALDTSLG